MENKTYSTKDVSVIFGVTVQHIHNLVHKGEIPHIKLGRRITIPAWWIRQKLAEPKR